MPPLNTKILSAIIAGTLNNNQLPSEPTEAIITMQSSVTLRGVTFNFNKPMPVCYSCLGDPAVISTESFQITSITPISDTDSNGFIRNGAMLNPTGMLMSVSQGFDGRIGDTSFQSQSATPYVSSVNIDPNVNGSYNVVLGFSGSVVKSVRDPAVTTTTWRTVIDYVVLTILPSVPLAGFFRPPMAGTDKTIKVNWREGVVNYNILRKETIQPSMVSLETAESYIHPTSPFFQPGGNGEQLRRLNIEDPLLVDGNYSRNFAFIRTDALNVLHSNYTNQQKRTLFLRVIQHGIDLFGELNNGFTGLGGAGQGYGRQFQPYYAAFALSDIEILAKAREQRGSSVYGQHFWVKSSDVGFPVLFPRSSGQNRSNQLTYLDSDIGIPEWEQSPGYPFDRSAALDSRYRDMWVSGIMEYLNIALLVNGPNNIDGVQAIIDGIDDINNPRSAAANYYDRMIVRNPLGTDGASLQIRSRIDVWNTRRPLISKTQWTGRPDWVIGDWEKTNLGLNHISSTIAGQINFNFPSHSTLPVISRRIRWSQDAIQYIEQDVTSNTGSITGLSQGHIHFVGFQETNSAGTGRFSTNTPWAGPLSTNNPPLGNQRPNNVLVAGTPNNSPPVNTLSPLIFQTKFPLYKGEEYELAPSTLTTEFLQRGYKKLICGLGYWTGFPAPNYTYTLKRNDVAVFTGKEYEVDSYADSGSELQWDISATNSQGTTVMSSNIVNIPIEVEPTIPSSFPQVQNISDTAPAGTTQAYLERLTKFRNMNDSLRGTIAIKGTYYGTLGSTLFTMGVGTEVNDLININIRTTGAVRALLKSNTTGGVVSIASINASSGTISLGQEFTIIVTWDIPNNIFRISVNGVVTSTTISNITSIPLNSTTVTYRTRILASSASTPSTGSIKKARLKYVYMNTESSVDITNSSVRAKFDDINQFGGWGNGISGTRPIIFLRGTASDYNNNIANFGIGGQIDAVPNIFNNASAPDDDRNGTILAEFVDV